jgi:ABC-type antimicrobial peptide transport system permease subunit
MALLFQFGLERRATEIGTLLALGFRPRQVRLLLLGEGALLALIGGWLGAACGIFYAQAMIRGLTTVWRGAVGTSSLHYHADISTLVIGAVASAAVAAVTIWFTLRHQARRPVRELLALGADLELVSPSPKQTKRNRGPWIGLIAGAFAVALIGFAIARRDTSSADTFFGAGALLLVAGLGFCAAWLGSLAPGKRSSSDVDLPRVSLTELGFRSNARRRKRSLATIGFLACGVFLIVAIGAFRLDAQKDSSQQSSGTGGFALLGEATLPVTYDLNSRAGRDFYGLNPSDLPKVSVVAFRVRDGDDASCLNLNRAQRPRLLGVDPQTLHDRGAFTFAEVAKGADSKKDWLLLKQPNNAGADSADEIPAIADENSILWSLGKKIGDAVDYVDAEGRPFKLRLVGALANSILQGNLIIDESEFVRRFPDVSGYRLFLVDTPSDKASEVSATLTKALQDAGLELTRTTDRLNAFNAVQNTYLSTFQALGGLGLLLGSVGLGIVVLRNIQERRGELALLLAVGFQRRTLKWLVLTEHAALLAAGLGVGVMAALIGILPSVLNPGSQVPYSSLMLTVAGVFANGLVWAWLATWFALRGKLLDALRNS